MITKVYIASPYTIGDKDENVKLQIDIASELIDRGYAPYVPLLSHFIHLHYEKHYDEWMILCFAWLAMCDCILRLPGVSAGADREVKYAQQLDIPVFYSINELLEKMEAKK